MLSKFSSCTNAVQSIWPRNQRLLLPAFLLPVAFSLSACFHVKTDPIRIEPIYVEITINHRIQQELRQFFAEIDEAARTAVPVVPQD